MAEGVAAALEVAAHVFITHAAEPEALAQREAREGRRGAVHGAAEVLPRALAGAGAELVTTEMVAFEWLRTCEHPDFKEAASKVLDILQERFGREVALQQLRITYSELAGIGQFADNLRDLELEQEAKAKELSSSAGSADATYLARKEFYSALQQKLTAAATARLRFDLDVEDDEFFRRLFAIKPEMGLPPLDPTLPAGIYHYSTLHPHTHLSGMLSLPSPHLPTLSLPNNNTLLLSGIPTPLTYTLSVPLLPSPLPQSLLFTLPTSTVTIPVNPSPTPHPPSSKITLFLWILTAVLLTVLLSTAIVLSCKQSTHDDDTQAGESANTLHLSNNPDESMADNPDLSTDKL